MVKDKKSSYMLHKQLKLSVKTMAYAGTDAKLLDVSSS